MEIQDVIKYNIQQINHIKMVQQYIHGYCNRLMTEAIDHDQSKFNKNEYEDFVSKQNILNTTTNGLDDNYKNSVKSSGIQTHIKTNPHHPEYWDELGTQMPIHQAIIMYYDWKSRSVQRGTKMEDFWEHNTRKLKNHPRALAMVELLAQEDGLNIPISDKTQIVYIERGELA